MYKSADVCPMVVSKLVPAVVRKLITVSMVVCVFTPSS